MTLEATAASGELTIRSAERFAIQLMIMQSALFAAETAVIHHIGSRASIMQLALIRGAAGLVLALIVARQIRVQILNTRQLLLQLLRGNVSLLYLWVMIYSFKALPFADATAISYTQAGYIAVFSVLVLGESVAPVRWIAAAVGMFGALLIAKPAVTGWDSVYMVALLGTGLNGLAFVLNKYLQRQDSEATTLFYTNLVVVVGSVVPAFAAGDDLPARELWPWFAGLFIFGPVGMYLGIVAVKHAPASMLGPYTLLRLVIGLVGGMIVFNELPDIFSGTGAVLILAACLLVSYRLPQPASYWRNPVGPARTL